MIFPPNLETHIRYDESEMLYTTIEMKVNPNSLTFSKNNY